MIVEDKPTPIVSTLGAVSKLTSGEYCLIHDCSMPLERKVNSCVPELEKFHF